MLDRSKRENATGLTVKEFIHILSRRPQDAIISCCGDECVYVHQTKDDKVVSIDISNLDDYYDEMEGKCDDA